MMLPIKDEVVVVSSRTGSSNFWFYLSIEFLIGAIISGFLLIFEILKSLLPKPPRDLSGDVVLIVGASTLGATLAEKFVKSGCSVICIDNDLRFVEEITRKLKSQSNKVKGIGPDYRKCGSENANVEKSTIATYKCDLLNRDAIREIAKKIEDDVGGIDVLVICAGQSNQDIFDVASTTLMSHYWTMLAFLPSLLQSDRPSYVIGIMPVTSSQDAFSSSRIAIAGLMESLGKELSNNNNNLTFLAISPMIEHSSSRQEEEQVAKEIIQTIRRGSQQSNIIINWCLKLYEISSAIYNRVMSLTQLTQLTQ